jgi:dihydropteroate synthase
MLTHNTPLNINCGGRLIDLSRPLIMGVLNVTPDSFYDGGRYLNPESAGQRVSQMRDEGMDILDVGSYSSRPGAGNISSQEEWDRLEPVLKMVTARFPDMLISVDTFRAEIARMAVEDYGAGIINDISGGRFDKAMAGTAARLGVPVIIMHMQGSPQTMQVSPSYDDLTGGLIEYFSERIALFREAGVKDLIIDPGFGFGKTLDQNYELLARMEIFQFFDIPVLAGLSRKSMIYKFLGQSPEDALPGTTVLNVIALQKGALILRVHDVKEAVICRNLVEKVNSSQ